MIAHAEAQARIFDLTIRATHEHVEHARLERRVVLPFQAYLGGLAGIPEFGDAPGDDIIAVAPAALHDDGDSGEVFIALIRRLFFVANRAVIERRHAMKTEIQPVRQDGRFERLADAQREYLAGL